MQLEHFSLYIVGGYGALFPMGASYIFTALETPRRGRFLPEDAISFTHLSIYSFSLMITYIDGAGGGSRSSPP